MKKYSVLISLVMVFGLLLTACGTVSKVAGDVVTEYHTLIEKYQSARKMASNFRLCVDTAMGTIYTQATFLQNYQQADIEKAKVWRAALQDAGSKIADLMANYKDANGNPIPVDQLDLGALAKAGALPDGVSSGLGIFVRAFQEAPLAAVSDAPVLAAMNTASEQYNKIDACGTDWNDAVEGYNVERNKIPGDVVGRIAEALHVKELPETLPYYAGDYSGSVSQPNLPTAAK
jgi:major membrane immunogen (membrane-anchored lipoprotein)